MREMGAAGPGGTCMCVRHGSPKGGDGFGPVDDPTELSRRGDAKEA